MSRNQGENGSCMRVRQEKKGGLNAQKGEGVGVGEKANRKS